MPILSRVRLLIAAFCLVFTPATVLAEADIFAATLDNDAFVNNDNGYTNGLYFSWFDTPDNELPSAPGILLKPLLWTIEAEDNLASVKSWTLSQTMLTPSDIEIEVPPLDDLPYAGMLALNNTYVSVNQDYADRISTTIGIVGPLSGAEQTQKLWHRIIDAPEPLGWDTQLENEPVFQFSRARVWRYWSSDSDRMDVLFDAEGNLGTISSSVRGGVVLRYGKNLVNSFATALYNSSRVTNFSTTRGDWQVYLGLSAGFVANQIFTDGNTFRDSRSIDYDRGNLGLMTGFSFSSENWSISYVVNDNNLLESDKGALRELDRYGSLTLSIRM